MTDETSETAVRPSTSGQLSQLSYQRLREPHARILVGTRAAPAGVTLDCQRGRLPLPEDEENDAHTAITCADPADDPRKR